MTAVWRTQCVVKRVGWPQIQMCNCILKITLSKTCFQKLYGNHKQSKIEWWFRPFLKLCVHPTKGFLKGPFSQQYPFCILKVLHGTINANKEPSFLESTGTVRSSITIIVQKLQICNHLVIYSASQLGLSAKHLTRQKVIHVWKEGRLGKVCLLTHLKNPLQPSQVMALKW